MGDCCQVRKGFRASDQFMHTQQVEIHPVLTKPKVWVTKRIMWKFIDCLQYEHGYAGPYTITRDVYYLVVINEMYKLIMSLRHIAVIMTLNCLRTLQQLSFVFDEVQTQTTSANKRTADSD